MYLNVQHTDRSRDCLKYCLTVIHFATTQNQPTPSDYHLQLPPCRHAFVSLREWSYFLVFKTNYSNFGWKKGITLLYSAPYCFARVLRQANRPSLTPPVRPTYDFGTLLLPSGITAQPWITQP